MLNKGWAVTELSCSPSPFSQPLFSVLYLVLLSWAWLWSGFSFWKWQVISQYVFTICIRLSKEATNGLCHGTVSARFLGTSSDAERAANAREFNEGFYKETFDIIIHSSVQVTNLGWGPFEGHLCLCCSHQSCLCPAWCPGEQGLCKGGWIVVTPSGPVLHLLGADAVTAKENSWNPFSPSRLAFYLPQASYCIFSR